MPILMRYTNLNPQQKIHYAQLLKDFMDPNQGVVRKTADLKPFILEQTERVAYQEGRRHNMSVYIWDGKSAMPDVFSGAAPPIPIPPTMKRDADSDVGPPGT